MEGTLGMVNDAGEKIMDMGEDIFGEIENAIEDTFGIL